MSKKTTKVTKVTKVTKATTGTELINRGFESTKLEKMFNKATNPDKHTYSIHRCKEGQYVECNETNIQSPLLPIRWCYEVARKAGNRDGDIALSIDKSSELIAIAKGNAGSGKVRDPLGSYESRKATLEAQKARYEAKLVEIDDKINNLVEPVIEDEKVEAKDEAKPAPKKQPKKKASSKGKKVQSV